MNILDGRIRRSLIGAWNPLLTCCWMGRQTSNNAMPNPTPKVNEERDVIVEIRFIFAWASFIIRSEAFIIIGAISFKRKILSYHSGEFRYFCTRSNLPLGSLARTSSVEFTFPKTLVSVRGIPFSAVPSSKISQSRNTMKIIHSFL
eukprot:TRINITY_DN8874_c0_g1_i1.p1 TRINITY_DN8874_c0_g1~~TRINITY_DN8874_c0_g1_i1.p1  ORF type:complete len:146 (+),score=7.43 TRINITY_DN8874_c0_g1_i1:88-525(+)